MKKAIAFILAVATISSAAITSFASATEIDAIGKSGVTGTPSALVFGKDASTGSSIEDLLLPGKTYKFPVSAKIGEETTALTKDMMKDHKFQISGGSNRSAVKSFELTTNSSDNYELKLVLNQTYGVKDVEVKYNVKLIEKANSNLEFAQEVLFEVGYKTLNQNVVDNLDKGDEVYVDNDSPVITADQFEQIAKVNNYRNAMISGDGWSFTGNFTQETSKNMFSDRQGIAEVLSKLPNNDFEFINFRGTSDFRSFGTVTIDVAEFVEDYGTNFFVYRYMDGKMYKLNASYNKEDKTASFKTNKLGSFVVSKQEIKDGFVVDSDASGDSDSDSDKTNPDTGANGAVNAAVVFAMVSLAAAGAVALKKASK